MTTVANKVRPIYITINTTTFEIKGYRDKQTMAKALKVHRNTIPVSKNRVVWRDLIVIPIHVI